MKPSSVQSPGIHIRLAVRLLALIHENVYRTAGTPGMQQSSLSKKDWPRSIRSSHSYTRAGLQPQKPGSSWQAQEQSIGKHVSSPLPMNDGLLGPSCVPCDIMSDFSGQIIAACDFLILGTFSSSLRLSPSVRLSTSCLLLHDISYVVDYPSCRSLG